jgi:hypothetical protein
MNEDELLRSAVDSAKRADNILTLSVQSENDLYAALAQQLNSVSLGDPSAFTFDKSFNIDDLLRDDATIGLGQRIFRRWNRTLYQFACRPDSEDQDIRDRLLSAITGREGGVAVIAGVLVAAFGASPAVAAIVAALLLKIVIKPAAEEICLAWSKSADAELAR